MGAWAGKRQRPCANMDNARSLDQRCVNHEFIKSKPLGTRGARVLSRIFAKTRQAPGQLPARTTSYLLFGWNHGQLFPNPSYGRVADDSGASQFHSWISLNC
jgi:hypothetical protein